MFEKEAEEYIKEHSHFDEEFGVMNLDVTNKTIFQAGAEFGYNKANEWHYVKDGDLPKGKGAVLIYWKSGDMKCVSVIEPYKVTEDTHIIAWKEIVLPKESG